MARGKQKILSLLCLILFLPVFSTSCGNTGLYTWEQIDGKTAAGDNEGKLPGNNTTREKTLEILWQQGGYGEFLNPTIKKFKQLYPDYTVKVEYSTKVHDIIRPRLVAGNVPDLFMAHQSFFDFYGAIKAEQIASIDDVLNNRIPDSDQMFKDIFQENILNIGLVDGRHYLFPIQQFLNGFWYSKKLFQQKGWTAPTTWEDFMVFCEKVKNSGDGIAPFGYAGLNAPFYLSDSFILPSIAQLGGIQAIEDINNLKPGAWKSAAVIESIERVRMLVDKKYMYDDSLKINHIQSQKLFINGKIAMLPVGSWLDNEMKGEWPDDFGLTAIAPPLGSGRTKYMLAYNSFVAIPENAYNGKLSKEFMRLFYTKDIMATMAKEYQSMFPVKDNVEYAQGVLPEPVVRIFSIALQPDVKMIGNPWTYWYKTLDKKYQDFITAVVAKDITPREFCDEMEAEAENIRQDDSIPKYSVN